MEKRAVHWMQKVLFFTSISVALTLLFFWYFSKNDRYESTSIDYVVGFTSTLERYMESARWAKELECFGDLDNIGPELDFAEVPIGNAVFFLLTSCSLDKDDLSLTARQACAVESAAMFHRDKDVFLLILAPIRLNNLSETKNNALQALLTYPNVKIRHIDFTSYLTGTPLQYLMIPLQQSSYPVAHASDILRYATLYRFQGLYLDLDVILLRKMPPESNYVGAESTTSVAAGVIKFGPDRTGREMADACANELARSFEGKNWGNNGPGVITRVLYARCHVDNTRALWGKTCDGFKTHAPPSFYAIGYMNHKLFFMKNNRKIVGRLLRHSYLAHYWNKFTHNMTAYESGVPFHDLAEKYCPRVFKAVNGRM